MKEKSTVWGIILAVIAGFVGGNISGCLNKPKYADAQEQPQIQKMFFAETIVTNGLLLKDQAGIQRGAFLLGENGQVNLALYDKTGKKTWIALTVSEEGQPGLRMLDPKGTMLTLGSERDGYSRLQIDDKNAVSTAAFGYGKDGSLALAMMGAEGSGGAGIQLSQDGHARLGVSGKGEKHGVSIESSPNGRSTLSIHDSTGRKRAVVSVGIDGRPILWMLDDKGAPDITLGVSGNGNPVFVLAPSGEIAILNEQGKSKWKAPQ